MLLVVSFVGLAYLMCSCGVGMLDEAAMQFCMCTAVLASST